MPFPNYETSVTDLFTAMSSLVGLSILLTPLNNKLKTLFNSEETKVVRENYWIVAILVGVLFMLWVSTIFPELFYNMSRGHAVFFGSFAGAVSVGMYEAGFLKSTQTKDDDSESTLGGIEDAVYDDPDERDEYFPYTDVFGTYSFEKVEFPITRLKIWNQRENSDTYMACVRYAMWMLNNGQNIIEDPRYEQVNPREPWLRYLVKDPAAKKYGSSLQSVLYQAREEGYIDGRTWVNKEEKEIEEAIDRGTYILTGSYYGDWKYVKETGIYRETAIKKKVGHATFLYGYDKDNRLAVNSGGPKDGLYKIPKIYTKNLFSMYAIVDSTNGYALAARKIQLNNKLEAIIRKKAKGEDLLITEGMMYRAWVDPTYVVKKVTLKK